jgi:DNA-binding transcriptional regulator YbjK
MTYHFTGMDELLREAFTRFAHAGSDEFERRLAGATSPDEARAAVVGLVTDLSTTRRDLVLTHELYTLAAREPSFRDITNAWMARSRRALERHFDPTTARLLDALVEGLVLHRALDRPDERGDGGPHDAGLVADAVERITRA